jgi:hypothetical protein
VKRSASVTRSDDGYFEAASVRPELRAERGALSLIHFLREQGQNAQRGQVIIEALPITEETSKSAHSP